VPDARLFIVGPYHDLNLHSSDIGRLHNLGAHLVGRVPHDEISQWISAADVCLSQRTPGFPTRYYNHQDSLKISEYAALRKPIVAAGYAPSSQYLSSKQNPDAYSRTILQALNGDAPIPVPMFWEENIPVLDEAYDTLMNLAGVFEH